MFAVCAAAVAGTAFAQAEDVNIRTLDASEHREYRPDTVIDDQAYFAGYAQQDREFAGLIISILNTSGQPGIAPQNEGSIIIQPELPASDAPAQAGQPQLGLEDTAYQSPVVTLLLTKEDINTTVKRILQRTDATDEELAKDSSYIRSSARFNYNAESATQYLEMIYMLQNGASWIKAEHKMQLGIHWVLMDFEVSTLNGTKVPLQLVCVETQAGYKVAGVPAGLIANARTAYYGPNTMDKMPSNSETGLEKVEDRPTPPPPSAVPE